LLQIKSFFLIRSDFLLLFWQIRRSPEMRTLPPSAAAARPQGADRAVPKASGGAKTSSERTKTASETVKTASENAGTASETVKTASETAKTASETAKTAIENGKTAGETGKTASENAKTTSESGKTACENARTASETAKTASETAKTNSESGKTAGENARTASETAKTASGITPSASVFEMVGSAFRVPARMAQEPAMTSMVGRTRRRAGTSCLLTRSSWASFTARALRRADIPVRRSSALIPCHPAQTPPPPAPDSPSATSVLRGRRAGTILSPLLAS